MFPRIFWMNLQLRWDIYIGHMLITYINVAMISTKTGK
ncbi:Uncharacterized protein dnm_043070 [Desulfonema magnum]|uniref:Uncharacterized protein n=1 Tax=Desulfonema magnum TaxID=45655 RepID=A0A975BMN8_9BACT|nr:Uncharacterized protein dnm_043070 [Desulfonema magnum]